MRIVLLLTLLVQGQLAPHATLSGRVIDRDSQTAIAGANVTLVGEPGVARTDAAGRFEWTSPMPPAAVTVVVILPDGRVARPIRLDDWPQSGEVALVTEPAVAEALMITGIAPSIDSTPGASTLLLSRGDIELRNPNTLTQALENVAGVSAISDGGQGAVPAIRGLARGRSLIVVDGSRVSTERRAGPNASFLDPADIAGVEVARGPASVAYGSDAFGGVIAVRTRRAESDAPLQVRVSGIAGGGVPERGGDIELTRGSGENSFRVSARAREFDDYGAPSGPVAYSGWRDGGLTARWDHDAADRRWSIGWLTGLDRDIGRARSDSAAIVATTPFEDSHRLTASYETRSAGWFGRVRVDGLFGLARERTDQDRLATAKQPRNLTQADTSYRDAQMRIVADRSAGPVWIEAGADFQGRYGLRSDDTTVAYSVSGAIASVDTNHSIASAHRNALGLFGQASTRVTSRIRLTGGVRGDGVANTNVGGYFGDRHVANGAVAGLASASVSITPRSEVGLQFARGFRDPTLTDRFYRGPVGRGFIEGNPDLVPETSRQIDLTARWDLPLVRLSAAAYDYRIANLVERFVVGGTSFFYRNRGAARLTGAEIEAQTRLPQGFVVELSANASRGRDADTNTPIDDVAPGAVTLVVRHAAGARVGSYLRAAAVARHSAAGPSEVPTPGYVAIDAGSTWRLSSRFEVRGIARNLLNQQWYANSGPRWVYAPGRNASLTFSVLF